MFINLVAGEKIKKGSRRAIRNDQIYQELCHFIAARGSQLISHQRETYKIKKKRCRLKLLSLSFFNLIWNTSHRPSSTSIISSRFYIFSVVVFFL